jgi:hypothetical protein
MSSRYPAKPTSARLALAPGLLAAIILVATIAIVGSSWFVWVQYAVAILALICCVFAWQARQFWWLIGLVPIAVVFNPVFPFHLPGFAFQLIQLASAVVFIAAGVTIKVPTAEKKA